MSVNFSLKNPDAGRVAPISACVFSLSLSIFSLWFRVMRTSVYQFVNTTFHNGIGIAQHSVKHSFHDSQYNLVLIQK